MSWSSSGALGNAEQRGSADRLARDVLGWPVEVGIILALAVSFGAYYAGFTYARAPLQGDSVQQRSFTFSSDPTKEILAISFRGGLQTSQPYYSIYGDGRVEILIPGTAKEPIVHTQELSFAETEELLRFAVDHHLAESSREKIEKKLLAEHPGNDVPYATDGYDMIFSIRLASFSRDGEKLGPIENTIVIHYPAFLLRIAPGIEELQGLVGLQRRLLNLRERLQKEEMP